MRHFLSVDRAARTCLELVGLLFVLIASPIARPVNSATPRAATVSVPCPDYDGDGQVTLSDVQAVAARWRLTATSFDPDGDPATPNYAPGFDLDGDGVITVLDIQAAAARLGAACPCQPAIEFTRVPAYGSNDTLEGRVLCAAPAGRGVAVFIYNYGWYNKPYWASPVTALRPDGTFTTVIVTNAQYDPWATQIAAFLIPADYTPPLLNGPQDFPLDLWSHTEAQMIVSRVASPRVIQFAGRSWQVKASAEPVGPGPNYFSDRPADVAVDAEGRLRMRIVPRDGRWYSTEVVTAEPLGYGDYTFRIAALARPLDPNAVLGLFTWDDDAPQYNYREIDVELARWGDPANEIAQYVVQPWDTPGNMHRFDFDPLADRSAHCFAWRAGSVAFESIQTLRVSQNPKGLASPIAAWTYTGPDVPPAGAGHARINLWLMSGLPPTDGQAIEVVVEGFEFTPAGN